MLHWNQMKHFSCACLAILLHQLVHSSWIVWMWLFRIWIVSDNKTLWGLHDLHFYSTQLEIEIKFSESCYSVNEREGEITVRVQAEGRRATNVTVRVTPLNYDDFLSLGVAFPSNFPTVPDLILNSPNRATTGELRTGKPLLLCLYPTQQNGLS